MLPPCGIVHSTCWKAFWNKSMHSLHMPQTTTSPATLTVHQWGLFENVITLLSPFEQLTREVNSSEASAADVIPLVRALRRLFNKAADTDHGVKRGTRASQQLDGFFAEAPIPRNETALGFWRNNHLRFLAQMARKYPCAPCTSTDSERLFSSAAHILDEKRNRLSCNKAEMLIFAKKNMHLTKK